ncbi:hypothetical protein B0O99DRAFT_592114 [Bisporella sp. PMI_857]|nr:hypothetical protein B0O99DRAFT_592114 [Bisporella sp. PMI_857]
MSSPTLQPLEFPSNDPSEFVHIISNLLRQEECEDLIRSHTNLVPSNVTSQTIREREMFFDQDLAERLWSRIEKFYRDSSIVDEEGSKWKAIGLNDKFRFCKFAPHQDGRRLADLNTQSFMTINMYLNTLNPSSLGTTRVLLPTAFSEPSEPISFDVLAKVQPTLGSAAVFRDSLWHDGEELKSGVKYLLRTDVLYEREVPFDFEKLYGDLSDQEKGRKAVDIAASLEDAGNQSEAVWWYKKAFKLCPALER